MSGTHKSAKYVRGFSLAAAVIAVGGVIGAAWHIEWLSRPTSGTAPVQLSTAIGLLCLAFAVFLLSRGRRGAAVVLATVTALLSVGTALEWISDHPLGLDYVFLSSEATPVAGRMAMSTSLCLITLVLSLFLGLPNTWRPWLNSLRGMLGTVASMTGAILLVLALCRIDTFASGTFSNQMSVPAGAAIMLLGMAVASDAMGLGREKKVRSRWVAAPIALGIALGTLILWNASLRAESFQHVRAARQIASEIKAELSSRLAMESLAMRRMAERMANGEESDQGYWTADATNYYNDFQEFQAVEWISPQLRISWLVPVKGNERAIGLDLTFEARRRTAIDKAIADGGITVSRPIKLVQGGVGFLIYAPIFRNGKFGGIAAAVCRLDRFVGTLPPDLLRSSELDIRDSNNLVFSNATNAAVGDSEYPTADVFLDGLGLQLSVRPTLDTHNRSRSPLPAAILGCGLVMTLLSACAVLLWERATYFANQDKESRRFLETLSDTSVTITYVYSLRTKSVVYCNRFGLDFLGLTAELLYDAKGQWMDYLIHPDEQEAAHNRFAEFATLADREVIQFEQRLRNAEGQFRWMLHRECVMTRDTSGHPHLVLGFAQDLTERREAEEEIRIGKEVLDKIIDQSPIGLALSSPEGCWFRANKALAEILGRSVEELTNLPFRQITHPDDLQEDRRVMESLLAGEVESYFREKRYLHRSGAYVWVQLDVSLVRDSDNSPLFFVAQVQDITERKMHEAQMAEYGRLLELQKSELTRANAALQQENRVDSLTGISNRRWFDDRLEVALNLAERFDRSVALIMLDVDHFKEFNDTFGHDAGDQVLREVGAVLQAAVSEGDLAARFGGEEFALIVSDLPPDEVFLLAESIRKNLSAIQGLKRTITASFGIAVYGSETKTPFDLIKGADQMLYRAKRSGRNRVCLDPRCLDVRHSPRN